MAAFRATLEEVLEADLIVHVRDISHSETEEQAKDVAGILAELGVAEATPMIEVWNKIDRLPSTDRTAVLTEASRKPDIVAVSAIGGDGIDDMIKMISGELDRDRTTATLQLNHGDGKRRAWLYEQGVVTSEVDTEKGSEIVVYWTPTQAVRFSRL